MKILVTGAGGFVGKRLTRYLAENGHQVFSIVRSLPLPADKHYFLSDNISLLALDLLSLDCSQLPDDFDAVFTLAQSAHFREFPVKAEDVFTVNIAANFHIWQWAAQTNIQKCIHISSGGIYGGKFGKVFQEDDLLAVDSPLGFYLGSKLCAEIIFQNYKSFFKAAVILRPFFIYGPGQRKDMFIARLIESVRTGEPVFLKGKDGLRVNPVYVDDAVIAFSNALRLTGHHIINVAGPDILSLREVGNIIGNVIGKQPDFKMEEGMPADYVGNTDQSLKILDHPMTSFVDGISKTIEIGIQ